MEDEKEIEVDQGCEDCENWDIDRELCRLGKSAYNDACDQYFPV